MLYAESLGGMNESALTAQVADASSVQQLVCNALNVAPLAQDDARTYRFSGERLNDDGPLLVECVVSEPADDGSAEVHVTLNCADFMFIGHVAAALTMVLA